MAVVTRAPVSEAPSYREEERRLDLRRRDFLSAADLTPDELEAVLDRAAGLKSALRPAAKQPLAGRMIALLFQKPSLRTRVSFELAVRRLGGDPIHLGQGEVGLGVRESVEDVGHTLERWVDGVVARTFEQSVLEQLAASCRVPVVNALTDLEHPCQALADLLTLRERFGRLGGLSIAFIGEGNNVFHSLALAGCALGLEVRIAHPEGYGPSPAIVGQAARLGRSSGGRVTVAPSPRAAVRGVDAVYADTWISMGSETAAAARRIAFLGYTIDAKLLTQAPPHAVVLHCLPAHRGEEIAAEVIDGPRSAVFDQAENRLWVQQALLAEIYRPAG
jgi:ornithine carbamoyltransferase